MKRPYYLPHQYLGALVALFGLTVTYRWIFLSETIARLIPDSVNLGLNTPLLLTAAGVCCMALPENAGRSRALRAFVILCQVFLLLWPALIMLQHIFDISLGIDFVRIPTAPTENIPHPGRVAPNTCIGFLCAGIAFLLAKRQGEGGWRSRAFASAVAGVMMIGFSALAGYFLRLETLYRLTSFNVMLPPTAIGMSILGSALWLLRQHLQGELEENSTERAAHITRRTVGVLTLVALAAGIAGFAVMRETLERSLSQNLLLSVTTNASLLGNILDDRLMLHRTIANRPIVQDGFNQLAANPKNGQARTFLHTTAANLLSTGLSGAQLRDSGGVQLAASGTIVRDTARLEHRLRAGNQNAWLLWRDGYLLHTETPVRFEGKTVGSIVAEQRLPAFDKLLQDIRASGPATDALLCGRDGDNIVCAPTRVYKEAFSMPLFDANGKPARVVGRALLGETGVISAKDLRRVPVLAAFTPLQDFGLGLLIKIDQDTVYAPFKGRFQLLAILLAALVALGTLALRVQVRPLLKQLVREQERSKLAEEKAAGSERRLRAIADNLPVLISYVDQGQTYRFFNKTFEEWFGVAPAADATVTVAEALGPRLYEERRDKIERALAGERVEFEIETEAMDMRRHLRSVYIPDIDADGKVAGIYTLSMDVTTLKLAEKKMAQLARHDSLTGLPNRYQFNEKLPESMARCRRASAPMALMFLDIDHFKAINDSLGHGAGDAVLREFATRLASGVRVTDTVARLAGDEFTIILEQLRNDDEARNIADKIVAAIRKPFIVNGHELKVSTSIGIAYYAGGEIAPDALMERADKALYQAKESGRDTWRIDIVN